MKSDSEPVELPATYSIPIPEVASESVLSDNFGGLIKSLKNERVKDGFDLNSRLNFNLRAKVIINQLFCVKILIASD